MEKNQLHIVDLNAFKACLTEQPVHHMHSTYNSLADLTQPSAKFLQTPSQYVKIQITVLSHSISYVVNMEALQNVKEIIADLVLDLIGKSSNPTLAEIEQATLSTNTTWHSNSNKLRLRLGGMLKNSEGTQLHEISIPIPNAHPQDILLSRVWTANEVRNRS